MNYYDPNKKRALASITIFWMSLGFLLSYFLISPSSLIGYIGFSIVGFLFGNIIPAIVAMLLNKLGIPPSTITNIDRYKY